MANLNPVKALKAWEKSLHQKYNTDFSTPENRRKAQFYIDWLDHAVLRRRWTNEEEIVPGVWRSNHPTEERFREISKRGISTILNLRGTPQRPIYVQEVMLCQELGLKLIDVPMSARAAPRKDTLANLIDVFRKIERPFLMHCKSGADRTGLASAIYLMEIEGKSLSDASKMLSPRYLHFRQSKTGVLDRVLEAYAPFEGKKSFEEWARDDYEPQQVA
ncbi:protein tyrosine phosphatase [Aliishimia ponticola]|uniref:Protein tyrosine phosphatase n=1 Tax=Aliishimia ponticola TaxID=2499833 RepID=A0A4S4NKR2_9RHOB|nr:tyrosine-protein phosphatase [Aliishimia ponticola]THH36730.1 protein tyrosine phosphatase [Aliishimia ponticola]